LYPYLCTQCGHRFEKIQHFGAESEKVCPQCGGALERTLTVPGLSFKGAGWYVNDYAAKSSAPSEAATAEAAPAEKKSETKTKAEAPSGESTAAASPAASTSTPPAKRSTKSD
jgi:putative FmdB family regulatory protein